MKRKLIQIMAVDRGQLATPSIIGLCNDGTMWRKGSAGWYMMDTPPQPESVKKEPVEVSWVTCFDNYSELVSKELDIICADLEFINSQKKFYPNIDVVVSMCKAYKNFWGTEAGWKNKKNAARGNKDYKIDWKATWANALSNKMNHVYLNNNQKPEPVRRARSVS